MGFPFATLIIQCLCNVNNKGKEINMTDHDQELIQAYASLGETADRIACFQRIRERFIRQLSDDLRKHNHENLVWRLFQLRKSGKLAASQ